MPSCKQRVLKMAIDECARRALISTIARIRVKAMSDHTIGFQAPKTVLPAQKMVPDDNIYVYTKIYDHHADGYYWQ